MANRDVEQGWKYHESTKHSHWSVRNNPHFLDWPNQPLPFKIYKSLDPIPLPAEFPPSGVSALDAIAAAPTDVPPADELAPNLRQLSRILYFSGGITPRRQYAGGEILFRAAACTGALYEIEFYLVCGDLPGLSCGLYHWNPADMALRQLRSGDYRGVVAAATANEPAVARAPVSIVCTGTYWRNSWKYQARAYRHFGWDNGTILANLLSMAAALGMSAKLVLGFVDVEINRLLDLETEKEVSFSMVALGSGPTPIPAAPAEMPPLNYETQPLSPREVDYPVMRQMHEASSLSTDREVADWRGRPPGKSGTEPHGRLIRLEPLSADSLPGESLEEVILRRGSSRRFARVPISFAELSNILDRGKRGIAADFLHPFGSQLNDLYLIVNAVDGLAPGAYVFHPKRHALELLKEGNFRDQAGYLGLEQQLPADAAVAIFYLADLEALFTRFGNRGYRAVQTEAGIIGGKIYLAAYALRLGATGLTFYDDEVVKFFLPHAEGKSAIFLTAVGKRMRRKGP